MKSAILVDSTMPQVFSIDESNLYRVDLRINVEGFEYRASDVSFDQVISSIEKTNDFPKTSLPTIEDINNVLDQIIADGYDRVFVICLSSGLSGTFQTLSLVANEYNESKKIEVNLIDTKVMSVGNALVLDYLASMFKYNLPTSEMLEKTQQVIDSLQMYVILGELNHIYKGGRMSKASFTAGEFLNIRPLLKLNKNGGLDVANRVRGNKKMISTIMKYIERDMAIQPKIKIFLTETSAEENFNLLIDKLRHIPDIEVINITTPIDSVTGTHVGPNTIGIAWSIYAHN
ncbi:MAG: DegV family protein [Bacilli bacterium]